MRKRVFYYSFEELYDLAEYAGTQGEAGILATVLLEYYGFATLLAFTVVNNAQGAVNNTNAPQGEHSIIQGSSYIIFHKEDEEYPIFQILEQFYEEYNNYYDAVEETIEEIDEEIGEDLSGIIGEFKRLEGIEEPKVDMIGIIVFDGHNTGIAIGIQ